MSDVSYIFYEVMNYPIPQNANLLAYKAEDIKTLHGESPVKIATYTSLGKESSKLLDKVKKYQYIFRHIPYIEEVYLCNSLTFNAAKKTSDIDVFFVVSE